MSTTYSITILNKHGQSGQYALFSAPPQVTTTNGNVTVYSNVWMSQKISVGGNWDIKYSQDYYAWVGTSPSKPAPGVVVSTGSSALATLGSYVGGTEQPGSTYPMVVENGNVYLDVSKETSTAALGAFGIDTGSDFTTPNNTYLLGMGKVNSYGYVSPVASVLADNNSHYDISPIVKFYVGLSSQQPGTIVNFSQVTKTAGVIDFSSGAGIGKNVAVVSHNNDGTFTTQYFNAPQSVKFFAAKALAAGGYSFAGRLNWPAAIAAVMISHAIALVGSALVSRGYTHEHKETKNPDGSTTSTIYFGPKKELFGLLEMGDYKADWKASVAADKLDDKHVDEGVVPTNSLEFVQFGQPKKVIENGQGKNGNGSYLVRDAEAEVDVTEVN